MIKWKIPAGFASFGAAVSLLAGIIGGNPFGVILLRLILSAAICGGLGLGVVFIVNKFLPELSANRPIQQTKSGEEVDIVIDESIPLAQESDGGLISEPSEAAGSEEPVASAEPEEEVESLEPMETAEELGSPAGVEQASFNFSEEVEDSEEDVLTLEDADSEEPSMPDEFATGNAAAQVADFTDLDTLPDIDQFNPVTEEGAPQSKPSRKSSKLDEVVRNQDPENLARAVRTFMKKDQ